MLARELDATVCWFVDAPLRAGARLALKQTSKTVRDVDQPVRQSRSAKSIETRPVSISADE